MAYRRTCAEHGFSSFLACADRKGTYQQCQAWCTTGPSPKQDAFRPVAGERDECGFVSVSGTGFRNQIGNPNAATFQQIQQDFATYGARKCSDNGPSICKCDCMLDGIVDFTLPVPPEAMGNWIPNYPLPTSLQHAMIIDFLCCYNACNEECFGPTEGLSGSDGITPIGGNTSPSGGGKGDLTSPAQFKRR